ncbi:unnamed protein product [Paramecium sonneborni]|uniref:t-SNARE coiled-coil homology domain-containing protein n=1 Tax=Paramecium sonneborni TaxID=65129 RepID=A0A8S1KFE6_9CILI|nr:unnamed protein product [Paramecium sonneborni]
MNDDNMQNLLNKKQTFEQKYEEIVALTLRINQLQDSVQRNLDLDDEHMTLIQLQRDQSKKLLETIQIMINELERTAIGFEQKKQVKNAKQQLTKQKDRYQQLSKELNKLSFTQIEHGSSKIEQQHQSFEQQQQQEYSSDALDLEQQVIKERQDDINHIEKQSLTLQKLMNELGLKVNDQDQQLDLIVHDLQQTKSNVQNANQEIKEAAQSQKQSRSKYYIMLFIASMLLLGTLGALLIS